MTNCNVTDDAKLCQEMNNNIEKQCRNRPSKPVTATNIDTSNANTQPLSKRIFNLADKIRWIKTELQAMKEQDKAIAMQFHVIGANIIQLNTLMACSPFTSEESLYSVDENLDFHKLDSQDQCMYEFRGRASSLLLPRRKACLSPSLQRAATTNQTLNKITRPKSLTHLNSNCSS
ncbi:uncharacterized protein [Watersipora subatra]|uniref:uncharacterized protein n=1 Tax=Watersipora subatra TaxID=2589382 RepID=UPI00355BA591